MKYTTCAIKIFMRTKFLILSLLLFSHRCCAITVFGGGVTCQKWNESRSDSSGATISSSYQGLLLGYITGMNFGFGERDYLKDVDANIIIDWTDYYCKKKPEGDLFDSAAALFEKLVITKRKK